MSRSGNEPCIDAEEILGGIRRWVEVETPTSDAAAVNRLADMVEAEWREIGGRVERIPGRDGYGDHLTLRAPWDGDAPGILVLSHLDTVHPHGVLARNPFRREGDRVFGPGIYDMKGGAYLALHACRHLIRLGRRAPLPITFLYVSEEEVGSPTSRELIEREAGRAAYVLVTEPARDGGRIVTARKGVARYVVTATGRPAHSGTRHQDGRSAIREMAHQILFIEGLTDYERGITTNVGLVTGGTAVNVTPAACVAEVDVRVPDAAAAAFVHETLTGLKPHDPDVRLRVEGGLNRPPFEKTAAIDSLFRHARDLAAEIGIDLGDVKTGGGSDGNFTAALGVPTLDGLGVDGEGGHTEHEQLYFSSLEPRARLLLRLFETLGQASPGGTGRGAAG